MLNPHVCVLSVEPCDCYVVFVGTVFAEHRAFPIYVIELLIKFSYHLPTSQCHRYFADKSELYAFNER